MTWRVVVIDEAGGRVVIDERLTARRAHRIRVRLRATGRNAIVEAEGSRKIRVSHDRTILGWSIDDLCGR